MKHLYSLLPVIVLFISCSTTKVLFDAKATPEILKIGIADLNKESKHGRLFPKLDSNFRISSVNFAKRFIAQHSIYLNEKISCENPDVSKIKELCSKNALDGIILTHVQFRPVANQFYLPRPSKYFESVVYTKVFDKTGKMLYSIVHDSKEEYDKTATTYDEVNLSLGIVFQKISKIRQKTY